MGLNVLIGLLVWIFIAPLTAAKDMGIPFIRNYAPEEYHSFMQNWAIVQDHRGVIYVGNTEGILEFNGNQWNVIKIANNSTARSMDIAHDGTIYVGATAELGYLAINALGQRVYVSLKQKLPDKHRNFLDVWDCLATPQGIYFFTQDNIIRWHEQTMTVISTQGQKANGYLINKKLFAFIENMGIARIDGNQVTVIASVNDFFPHQEIGKCILLPFPKKETLLVISDACGLFLFNWHHPVGPQSWQLFPNQVFDFLKDNILYRGLAVNPNLYALGSKKGGLVLMNSQGELLQVIGKKQGLRDNSIRGLMLDQCQNMWVAMNDGLAQVNINSPLTRFNETNGLDGMILSVIRHQQTLYVGTYQGVFYLPDHPLNIPQNTGQFKPVKNTSSNCFAMISVNRHLLASNGQGLSQIIQDNAYWLTKGISIYGFSQSRKFPNHIFIAANEGFLALEILESTSASIQDKDQQRIKVKIENKGDFQAIKESIRFISEDHQGDLWLTSNYNGLLQIKFFGSNISNFRITRYGIADGLPELTWNYIYLINKELLAATQKGIYQVKTNTLAAAEKKEYRFIPHPELSNVFSKPATWVQTIIPDQNNRLWVFSGDGMGLLTLKTPQHYEWDNTPFCPIKGGVETIIVEDNGLIWICGVESKSLFRFDTNKQKDYQQNFHTLVSRVVAGKDTLLFSGNHPQAKSADSQFFKLTATRQAPGTSVSLSYHLNSLTFYYSAAYYEHDQETRFCYRLQGFDRDWSEWTTETKAVYTNISEGNYQFTVKAINVFHHAGHPAEFHFSIRPPWFRTFWAYAAYLLFFGLAIWGIIRLNTRRLLANQKRLKKIISERTEEVRLQRDEIGKQKTNIEHYAQNLFYTNQELAESNHQLKMTKDALWGEMELAKKIQTVLLPDKPTIPGYEIAAYMKPADEVGGDYYDVICIDNNDRRGGACFHPDSERAKEINEEPCRGGSCARPKDSGQLQEADLQHPNMGNHKGLPLHDLLSTNHHPPSTAFMPSHWLAIGDVSGHGVPAGLVMMMVQTSIQSVLEKTPTAAPDEILKSVNRVIYKNIKKLGEDKYMTITLMSVQKNGVIHYSGLHQDLLVYRAAQNTVEMIETNGIWIGIMDDIEQMNPVNQLILQTNDILLLYTDGIPEAESSDKQLYSQEKLSRIFRQSGHQPPAAIIQTILHSLEHYTCNDDITLLLLKRMKPSA